MPLPHLIIRGILDEIVSPLASPAPIYMVKFVFEIPTKRHPEVQDGAWSFTTAGRIHPAFVPIPD